MQAFPLSVMVFGGRPVPRKDPVQVNSRGLEKDPTDFHTRGRLIERP
jgi:hypothetical protein